MLTVDLEVSGSMASLLPPTVLIPKCFAIVDHKTILAVTNVAAKLELL